jgi:hypothetical protein
MKLIRGLEKPFIHDDQMLPKEKKLQQQKIEV